MQHQLVIFEGPDAGRTLPLIDGQTRTVGRGQASDVRLNDPRVSRIHVRLQVDQGAVVVQDAGSSSGTLVNGGPIEQHTLRPGDVIQIGDTKLRYQLEGARDESTLVDSAFGPPKPPPKVVPLPELVSKIRNEEPPKPKTFQLSIPDMFQDIVMRMLSKRPEDRYQTPTQLLKDLRRVAKYQGMEAELFV